MGSNPGRLKKMGLIATLLCTRHQRVGFGGGGLDLQMISERGTAAAHRSLRGCVKCAEQISHSQVCDSQWDFNLELY